MGEHDYRGGYFGGIS